SAFFCAPERRPRLRLPVPGCACSPDRLVLLDAAGRGLASGVLASLGKLARFSASKAALILVSSASARFRTDGSSSKRSGCHTLTRTRHLSRTCSGDEAGSTPSV